jgi:hypothetical protein
MKPFVFGSVLGAIAAVAMLSPLAAVSAAAQIPGGSYLQSCHDVQVRGDRMTATCRTGDGDWNQTSLNNIGQCAGGLANNNGRLACGTHGGGFNMGSDSGRDRRDEGRQADRDRRDDDRRSDGRRSERDRRDYGSTRDRDWRDHGGRRDREWSGSGSTYAPYGPAPARDPWGRW